jgi:hypothetical protein
MTSSLPHHTVTVRPLTIHPSADDELRRGVSATARQQRLALEHCPGSEGDNSDDECVMRSNQYANQDPEGSTNTHQR